MNYHLEIFHTHNYIALILHILLHILMLLRRFILAMLNYLVLIYIFFKVNILKLM